MDFTPKRATETEVFTVEFANLLAAGETIQSAVWTSSAVAGGVDPNANATIQGSASITGSKVSTKITAGLPGIRYAPICTAQTNLQTLVLPEYGMGQLEVTL